MYTITLPVFEGPLDLLLQLIERAELDITTVALAEVADQYMAHVRAMDEPDPRAMAEFVSLAARLLLIKSRALLPRPAGQPRGPDAEGDGDGEALARQLREYQRYRWAAAVLRQWQEEGRRSFLRTAPVALPAPAEAAPLAHSLADLVAALQRRMQLRLPLDAPAPLRLAPRLTVGQVARQIRDRLARGGWFEFEDLLSLAVSRQELIVTFWAVLELLKRRAIVIEQPELFGPISIGRGEAQAVDLWEVERPEEEEMAA